MYLFVSTISNFFYQANSVIHFQNRYHEFGRVYRVWNHMAQLRRSGQCHSFDDALPHRRKSSVTVRCPACPEVHFNVDQKTVELAFEDEA